MNTEAQTTAIAALEVVPFAMLITDSSARVLAVNQRWIELSGLGRAPSLGTGWLSVLEPDSRARLRDETIRVGRDGGTATADYQLGGAPNEHWTRWWISRHELDGTALVAIAVADVHEDYARQANLYHLATHDSLTGLINRSHFIESIEQALRRNQRMARHVGVIYVDLDGFKRVNDRGGHSLGDRVLYAIAARLRHAVRSADLVARIGGDEFAVLCEGLNAAEQAYVVAQRISQALTESVDLDGERWSVFASVGAAVDQGGPDSAEDLVDRADRAMYSIKLSRRTGRDGDDDARTPPPSPSAVETPPDDEPEPRFEPEPEPESATSEPEASQPESVSASEPEASEPGASQPESVSASQPESESSESEDPTRSRLLEDVGTLRESIDSIRRMLDRLLTSDPDSPGSNAPGSSVIDIRERQDAPERD